MDTKLRAVLFLILCVYLSVQTNYLLTTDTYWIADRSHGQLSILSTSTIARHADDTTPSTTATLPAATPIVPVGPSLAEHVAHWLAEVGGSQQGLCTDESRHVTRSLDVFSMYHDLLLGKRPRTVFRRFGRRERPLLDELESRERVMASEPAPLRKYVCWLVDVCRLESIQRDPALCPCLSKALQGFVKIDTARLTNTSWRDLADLHPELKPGGSWAPTSCVSRRRVAIIVPFRDREMHLRAFLAHIHPILQRQLLDYRIFVVEQNLPYLFNKAAVMNAGYLEVKKFYQADCVLFHDVDTFIERDDNMIFCADEPIHWAGYSNRYEYEYNPYLFGSAVLLRPEQFEHVNGFSNLYYGWGGEDDNLKHRFLQKKISIYRGPLEVHRCTILEHQRDRLFTLNDSNTNTKKQLYRMMETDMTWQEIDGLNTARYDVLETSLHNTHTHILIDVQRPVLKDALATPKQTYRGKVSKTDHKAWARVVEAVAYRREPAKFNVTRSICALNETDERHFLSRVSCRFRCEQRRDCRMFEYHHQPRTALDSYCVLRRARRCRRVRSVRALHEQVEIHTKQSRRSSKNTVLYNGTIVDNT